MTTPNDRIRQRRTELGLSLADLERLLISELPGMTRTKINNIEKHRRSLHINEVRAFARALKLDERDLI